MVQPLIKLDLEHSEERMISKIFGSHSIPDQTNSSSWCTESVIRHAHNSSTRKHTHACKLKFNPVVLTTKTHEIPPMKMNQSLQMLQKLVHTTV